MVLTSNSTLTSSIRQEVAFSRFLKKIKMKKFILPFQNMVRADLFSGSLAVWNALDLRIHGVYPVARRRRWYGTRPPNSPENKKRIPFSHHLTRRRRGVGCGFLNPKFLSADEMGFEPTILFLVWRFSKPLHSTTMRLILFVDFNIT
ncbi:MAG: hypothetical protein CEO12_446 [Parcubacteria group bacterium Gr01-1014_46]|nr:MAG: hypothetical protein CEO12_446 [Parcubacteria group bacterium Gr01-1014_46]